MFFFPLLQLPIHYFVYLFSATRACVDKSYIIMIKVIYNDFPHVSVIDLDTNSV